MNQKEVQSERCGEICNQKLFQLFIQISRLVVKIDEQLVKCLISNITPIDFLQVCFPVIPERVIGFYTHAYSHK